MHIAALPSSPMGLRKLPENTVRRAAETAAVRELTSSLEKMWARCDFTVVSLTKSSAATSVLDLPAATSSRTSISRVERFEDSVESFLSRALGIDAHCCSAIPRMMARLGAAILNVFMSRIARFPS